MIKGKYPCNNGEWKACGGHVISTMAGAAIRTKIIVMCNCGCDEFLEYNTMTGDNFSSIKDAESFIKWELAKGRVNPGITKEEWDKTFRIEKEVKAREVKLDISLDDYKLIG